jgi:nitroreductase
LSDNNIIRALDQAWIREAAAVVVFAAVYERTTRKYGKRGIRYVHIEAGHAAENLFLQAVSLDLNTVIVGAFRDDAIRNALKLPQDHARRVQKIARLLSNLFTTARLSRVERCYASCADRGNITFLPLHLPSSDGVRLGEAVFYWFFSKI